MHYLGLGFLAILIPLASAKDNENINALFFKPFEPAENGLAPPYLFEQFVSSAPNWIQSESSGPSWVISELSNPRGFLNDYCLRLFGEHEYIVLSRKLDSPVAFGSRPIVLQFEVQSQGKLDFGDAVLTLLTGDFDQNSLDGNSKFAFRYGAVRRMVGHGSTKDEVHFSFQTSDGTIRVMKDTPMTPGSRLSTLYSFVYDLDGTIDLRVNNESILRSHRDIIIGSGKQIKPITGIAIIARTGSEGGVAFDNILLSNDIKSAKKIAEKTWLPKVTQEEKFIASTGRQGSTDVNDPTSTSFKVKKDCTGCRLIQISKEEDLYLAFMFATFMIAFIAINTLILYQRNKRLAKAVKGATEAGLAAVAVKSDEDDPEDDNDSSHLLKKSN